MITIIDYGVGNLFSIRRSLDYLGFESAVSREAGEIERADKLILPGVGAFGDAMDKLTATGLRAPIVARVGEGAKILGICLGMQLLFDESCEYGRHEGLSLIPGKVSSLKDVLPQSYKIPQIGWNALQNRRGSALTREIKDGDCVYYVHSYYVQTRDEYIVATSEYGVEIPGVVERQNVYGCQFHPEKSGGVGLKILRAFAELEG